MSGLLENDTAIDKISPVNIPKQMTAAVTKFQYSIPASLASVTLQPKPRRPKARRPYPFSLGMYEGKRRKIRIKYLSWVAKIRA